MVRLGGKEREGYLDDCTTDASRPGVEDEQGGIRKEGRKGGAVHYDRMLNKQMPAYYSCCYMPLPCYSCYMQCTWNLE